MTIWRRQLRRTVPYFVLFLLFGTLDVLLTSTSAAQGKVGEEHPFGREVAIPRHLQDDEEFRLSVSALLGFGKQLFAANWTDQEGGGRPLTKGNGRRSPIPRIPSSA